MTHHSLNFLSLSSSLFSFSSQFKRLVHAHAQDISSRYRCCRNIYDSKGGRLLAVSSLPENLCPSFPSNSISNFSSVSFKNKKVLKRISREETISNSFYYNNYNTLRKKPLNIINKRNNLIFLPKCNNIHTANAYVYVDARKRKIRKRDKKLIVNSIRNIATTTGKATKYFSSTSARLAVHEFCWHCNTDLSITQTDKDNSMKDSIVFFCPNVECQKVQSIVPPSQSISVSTETEKKSKPKNKDKDGKEAKSDDEDQGKDDREQFFYMYYYDLFNISWRPSLSRYDIDLKKLEQKYRQIQKQLHPDNFKTSSIYEQELSQENSSYVNLAYNTLKNPINRAIYIMEQNGVHNPLKEEKQNTNNIDQQILIDVMEAREVIEEATSILELDTFLETNQEQLISINSELSSCVEQQEYMDMDPLVIKLQYYTKLGLEASEKRNKLEDRLDIRNTH